MRGARITVIALHCSGGGAGQWRTLHAALGPKCELVTPEHYGSDSVGPWPGEHPFSLCDEAARIVHIVDASSAPVHLVGHSYGGAVALQVALERPRRLASLSVYEPCAFPLLRELGEPGERALADLRSVAARMMTGLADGAYVRAAQSFVDYWSGSGAWTTLRASARTSVVRWVAKAPLEFHALVAPDAPRPAYASLDCPTLIMRGEHAPLPTRLIADALQTCMPRAWREVIEGAGHMGPLTHSATVNALVGRHIARFGFEGHGEGDVSPTGPGELVATI